MKNKLTLGIIALGVIAILGISLVSAFPMMNGHWDVSEEEIQEQQKFMEQVRTAIENENFEDWRDLMMSQINLENFNKQVEKHQEMQKYQEQREEQRQLCLENPENCPNFNQENWEEMHANGQGSENGQGQMHKAFNQEQRQKRWAFWKGIDFGFGKGRA
jgi:Mg-chelatase subunit ChlI